MTDKTSISDLENPQEEGRTTLPGKHTVVPMDDSEILAETSGIIASKIEEAMRS